VLSPLPPPLPTAANTVTWTATAGSIGTGPTATGAAQTYTAPGAGSTATVTATTVDTPAAAASATVTLVAPSAVAVTVTPATLELMTGTGTQQFAAAVSPITNTAVTWSGTGVSAAGLFSASGLAGGTYPVTATSQSLGTLTGSATVTLVAPASVSVAVTPTPTTVLVGATKQFTASVTGLTTTHQGVTWSVSGGGTISSSGLFTATTAGSFTVTATNSFSAVQGTAPVTVQLPVAIASFTAAKTTLTAGSSTSLSWVVTNSTSQAIDNGLGAVAATGSISVNPAVTTTYVLTAQGLGGPVTRSVTITAVAPASISSFTVTPTIVLPNRAATLTAVFTGGTGIITPGIGAVTSGIPITTPLLSAGTTYTLTVTNGAGDPITATATVAVSGSLNFDLNTDGVVDLLDLLTFAKHYGTTTVTALALADFNSDGKVDDLDLAILLGGL